ncbi:MAG TPA: hypothetical protein VHI52_16660, partial [Verrucomicrobiae bacterium]|nr:hypothetical protein [Verrucomicrobiae bacterium]
MTIHRVWLQDSASKGLMSMAVVILLGLLSGFVPCRAGAEVFSWNTNKNEVTVDFNSTGLLKVLERVAAATRWQVFVEPETQHRVSAKFKDVPPGEAL